MIMLKRLFIQLPLYVITFIIPIFYWVISGKPITDFGVDFSTYIDKI